MLTLIISITLSLFTVDDGGSGDIICCHTDSNGNHVCALPGPEGCESGDKAVVCRYGVWSDPTSGVAECEPGY